MLLKTRKGNKRCDDKVTRSSFFLVYYCCCWFFIRLCGLVYNLHKNTNVSEYTNRAEAIQKNNKFIRGIWKKKQKLKSYYNTEIEKGTKYHCFHTDLHGNTIYHDDEEYYCSS